MKKNTTRLVLTGLGVAVTRIGAVVGGPVGAGTTGFGVAHVVLGTLDMFRPSVRR